MTLEKRSVHVFLNSPVLQAHEIGNSEVRNDTLTSSPEVHHSTRISTNTVMASDTDYSSVLFRNGMFDVTGYDSPLVARLACIFANPRTTYVACEMSNHCNV